LYSKYDVLIIPSNHDGWAVVVAEAMASGLAIIGTKKTGAFEDLVLKNDCGLTCKVNKVSIISAVEKYIENVKMLQKLWSI
jgi:glycosyltransferase involved in cell wall biosynthesis